MAPAVPATMKLAPLHRKSSYHTRHADRPVDNAIAPATSPVLKTKHVAIAPTSGFAIADTTNGPDHPPSHPYTAPVAMIVIASAAMLNTVRYTGYGCRMFSVHCANTPTTAMTIACCGPSSRSAGRSAGYDTESGHPAAGAMGSIAFPRQA